MNTDRLASIFASAMLIGAGIAFLCLAWMYVCDKADERRRKRLKATTPDNRLPPA